MSATLVFGKAPTGDFSQIILGEKTALQAQKDAFLANTVACKANPSAIEPLLAANGPEELTLWHKHGMYIQ
jgi:hypothetical protein